MINSRAYFMKFKIFISLSVALSASLFIFTASTFAEGNVASYGGIATTITPSSSQECAGMSELSGVPCAQQSSVAQNNTGSLIKTIVSTLSYVLGVLAIVMIIFSGVLFATSAGDASKVKTAKSTLVYALIGIVIAMLVQIIIRWVLGASSSIAGGNSIGLLLSPY
jgi:hypothetical protein